MLLLELALFEVLLCEDLLSELLADFWSVELSADVLLGDVSPVAVLLDCSALEPLSPDSFLELVLEFFFVSDFGSDFLSDFDFELLSDFDSDFSTDALFPPFLLFESASVLKAGVSASARAVARSTAASAQRDQRRGPSPRPPIRWRGRD